MRFAFARGKANLIHAGVKEVRFRPGGGLLRRIDAEQGTHPPIRCLAAAVAAGVAQGNCTDDLGGIPVELKFQQIAQAGLFSGYRFPARAEGQRGPQIALNVFRIGADHLPGIQNAFGVQQLFDLAKNIVEAAELPGEAPRPAEAGGTFGAGRSPGGHYLLVERVGQPPHLLGAIRAGKVEEGADDQLPLRRVPCDRCGHLLAFEDVLDPNHEVRKCLRRHRKVVNHRHRAHRTLGPEPSGPYLPGQGPAGFEIIPAQRPPRTERQPPLFPEIVGQCPQAFSHLMAIVAVEFHDEGRFGVLGDQRFESVVQFPGQTQVPAIHQFARAGVILSNQKRGPHRAVEAGKHQQGRTTRRRQGLDCQPGLGDHSQRALGSGNQSGEVERSFVEDIPQAISRPVDLRCRAILGNHGFLGPDQTGQSVDNLPFSRMGAGRVGVVERLPADLENLPVGQNNLQPENVLRRGPVPQPAASRSVDRQHAADGCRLDHPGVGAEGTAAAGQEFIEPLVDDSRLDPDHAIVDGDDAAKIARAIEDQAPPQRAARGAGSASPRMHRNPLRRRVFQTRRNVGRGPGPHHSDGPDLVDARVSRVELQENVVASHITSNSPSQVCLDPFSQLVEFGHGDNGPESGSQRQGQSKTVQRSP